MKNFLEWVQLRESHDYEIPLEDIEIGQDYYDLVLGIRMKAFEYPFGDPRSDSFGGHLDYDFDILEASKENEKVPPQEFQQLKIFLQKDSGFMDHLDEKVNKLAMDRVETERYTRGN